MERRPRQGSGYLTYCENSKGVNNFCGKIRSRCRVWGGGSEISGGRIGDRRGLTWEQSLPSTAIVSVEARNAVVLPNSAVFGRSSHAPKHVLPACLPCTLPCACPDHAQMKGVYAPCPLPCLIVSAWSLCRTKCFATWRIRNDASYSPLPQLSYQFSTG